MKEETQFGEFKWYNLTNCQLTAETSKKVSMGGKQSQTEKLFSINEFSVSGWIIFVNGQ